jgi:uncharacterized membrane protein
MKALTEGLAAIALTLWVGGLWAIGYVVAPTLFASLPDNRALAGSLAGKLFTLMSYIGIACASYLLLFRLMRGGGSALKHPTFWIIVLMLVLVVAGQFYVQPILESMKNQALPEQVMESIFRDRFRVWHGVSNILYMIVSLLGALLVWLGARSR